jgi:hypothetical protein
MTAFGEASETEPPSADPVTVRLDEILDELVELVADSTPVRDAAPDRSAVPRPLESWPAVEGVNGGGACSPRPKDQPETLGRLWVGSDLTLLRRLARQAHPASRPDLP